MKPKYYYETVSVALAILRKKGFTIDFNLEENCISCAEGKLQAEAFDIVEVYRYEGNTDPSDEATVYAIESKTGLKGVLVTGYGVSENISSDILEKLK
ncbi:MAG: hypothetical protein IPO78_05780 [Saprospiraceae bacterium]|nr:hypothetical protein [Saprospiraceae bacterium]MBK8449377.1 hypothetical protein [Saprospiraceae bacterium]MBK8484553.1 hypothetical protein [Saprospiraceae bacterium]MBK9221982.1 hypothetical protein [Saprospiraceae bacterium]MBK9721113.1 hypothetical protein [Saprospiraceae bacterium]